jgi:homoserine kinase
MHRTEISVWTPATLANINVGFDGLGCALSGPGERLVMRTTDAVGCVNIRLIEGAELPLEASLNVAGVAAQSLLKALGNPCGLELDIFKEIKPGSGIGSSAASAAGAVFALNELLNAGLSPEALLPHALDGEALASGSRHADNVAPALMGGLVLCPPRGLPVSIPFPVDWHVVVLHPDVAIRTEDARKVLPENVSFKDAVDQARWLGVFTAGCYQGDGALAALALEDLLAGPHRAGLIPHFEPIRTIAMRHGAIAGGISGSGPSTFWVTMTADDSAQVAHELKAFMRHEGMACDIHQTRISARGSRIIE